MFLTIIVLRMKLLWYLLLLTDLQILQACSFVCSTDAEVYYVVIGCRQCLVVLFRQVQEQVNMLAFTCPAKFEVSFLHDQFDLVFHTTEEVNSINLHIDRLHAALSVCERHKQLYAICFTSWDFQCNTSFMLCSCILVFLAFCLMCKQNWQPDSIVNVISV